MSRVHVIRMSRVQVIRMGRVQVIGMRRVQLLRTVGFRIGMSMVTVRDECMVQVRDE